MNDETNEIEVEIVDTESPSLGALATINAGELDIQIVTSRRFPRPKDRDIAAAIVNRATLNHEIAKECNYAISRGNKPIQGPSIRFAEIIASCFRNIRVASRFIRVDDDNRMRQAVICEAIAYDTEYNRSETAQVRRSIMTSGKQGQTPRPYTPDQIAVTVMAAQAIARRNAILALVPKALWIDGYAKVMEVITGSADTLAERRTNMLAAFGKYGVEPEELFAAIGVETADDIGLNDMPYLTGLWTSLKEGEAVESVLGRAVGERVRVNPLANDPPIGDGISFGDPDAKERLQGVAPPPLASREARQEPTQEPKAPEPPKATRTRKARQEPTAAPVEVKKPEPPRIVIDDPKAPNDPHAHKIQLHSGEIVELTAEEVAWGRQQGWDIVQTAKHFLEQDQAAQEGQGLREKAEREEQEAREAAISRETLKGGGLGPRFTADEQRAAAEERLDKPAPTGDGIPGFLDRSGFVAEATAYISQFVGSAGSLLDWWRSKAKERAKLAMEDQTRLSQLYTGKFNSLNNENPL